HSARSPVSLEDTAWYNRMYNLSGSGTLNVFSTEYVGNAGGGIFTQSGGTHTVATFFGARLILGASGGSSGAYDLSGGSLIVNGNEHVGWGGPGSFTHSAGTHTIGSGSGNSELHLGEIAGSNGSYNLSGTGNLTVNGTEVIGVSGTGIFTQSGGTHTLGSQTQTSFFHLGKNAGSSGSYQL